MYLFSKSQMWEVDLIDTSLKGALIFKPNDWDGDMAQRCRLEIRLDSGLVISMTGQIARIEEDAIGFTWDRIDMDSFSRLKRLVEWNLGDPSLLERELSSLGHL